MGKGFVLQAGIVFTTPKVNSVRNLVNSINAELNKLNKTTTLKIEPSKNIDKLNHQIASLTASVNGYTSSINQAATSTLRTARTINGSITPANKQLVTSYKTVYKSINNTTDAFEKFGKQAAASARRYISFAAVTGAFLNLTSAIRANIKEAIDFDREVVRLSQVTGKTAGGLKSLTTEVDRLAKGLGVSSRELVDVSVTLAQAGLTATETKIALEAIAKSGVSASFGNMRDTGEAVIAIFQQFGYQAKDLEGVLSSVNKVSAAFAVEADDITTAVRRAGSSFQSAGATFNQFQALFTSVRQTTRESAESIATGLRTIISRLQRVRTQKFFENLGIELVDDGRFIGPLQAIERISTAVKDLSRQDPVFASIAEELGGFRQINKVIPLLDKFNVTRKALNLGLRADNSLTDDAITSQQALALQIGKVREEFQALIREIVNSDAFRNTVKIFLNISSAVIKTVDALQNLIPLLGIVAGARSAPVISKFTKGFFGFNKGGPVPGAGNGDTVPALLTPGEFVVNKASAKSYGYDRLAKINKYANGGVVGDLRQVGGKDYSTSLVLDDIQKSIPHLNRFVEDIKASSDAMSHLAVTIKELTQEEIANKTTAGGNLKGLYSPQTGNISLAQNSQLSTFRHELGHAADKTLKDIGFADRPERFASEIPNTFQGMIGYSSSERNKERERLNKRGASEQYTNYRLTPEEMFARFTQTLNKEQFAAAVSTTDPKIGSERLLNAGFSKSKLEEILGGSDVLSGILGSGDVASLEQPKKSKSKRRKEYEEFRKTVNIGNGANGLPPINTATGPAPDPNDPNNRNNQQNQLKRNSFRQSTLSGGRTQGSPFGGLSNPRLAGVAGVVGLGVLSSFSDNLNDLVPVITTLVSSFYLLNSVVKLSSRENKSTLDSLRDTRKGFNDAADSLRDRAKILRGQQSTFQGRAENIRGRADRLSRDPNANPDQVARLRREQARQEALATNAGNEANNADFQASEARRRSVNAKGDFRSRRQFRRRLVTGGAALGAVALAGAPFLSNAAEKNSIAGENKTFGINTTTAAGIGGGLTGAVSGAASGAAIGSIIGPAGTAIGAAVGGIVGGLYGLTNAIDESAKQIKQAQFGKEVQELRQRLRFVSEGKLSTGAVRGDILGNIRSTVTASSNTDAETRQNILATFGENQSEIEDFFYKIASESKTLDEFNKRTESLLPVFATLTKIPYKDLETSIKNTIDKSGRQLKGTQDQIALQSKLLQNITLLNVTMGAFNSAAISIEGTTRKLQQFSSAIDGTTQVLESRDVSSTIKSGSDGGIFNQKQFADAIRQVSSFVPNGNENASTAIESSRVEQLLPAILKRVASVVPTEGQGDFEDRLVKELSAITSDKGVISSILTGVGKIIGDTGEDKKVISRINEDVFGTTKELTETFKPIKDLFGEASAKLQDRINSTVAAFADMQRATENISNLELQRIDVEERLQNTINERLGRDNVGNAQSNIQRLQTITGGQTSVSGLLDQYFSSQSQIRSLDEQRNSLDPVDQQKVIKAQFQLATAADNARKGLEFLSRESNDLADRFSRDAEQGRELRNNALTSIVGTAEERTGLRRQESDIAAVRASGTFQSVSASRRREVAEKVELLFPEEFKRIFKADLISQGKTEQEAQQAVDGKTSQTDQLLQEIRNNATTQTAAISALQQIQGSLSANIEQGITNANSQFVEEIRGLSEQIKQLSDSIITSKGQEQQNIAGAQGLGKQVNNVLGTSINGSNFNSLKGLYDLLSERQNLLTQQLAPNTFESALNKSFTSVADIGNEDAITQALTKAEGFGGISLTKLKGQAPSIAQDVLEDSSITSDKKVSAFIKNLIGADTDNTAFDQVDKQIAARNATVNEKLNINQKSIQGTGFGIPSADIEKSVKLIKSFVEAVDRSGGIDKIPKFAKGGVVPGVGGGDRVLSLLTPGEVVLNKDQIGAVRNSSGGSGGSMTIDSSKFNDTIVKFSNSASLLSKSLDQFPREITLQANHKVEVIFNGAEVLSKMLPSMQELATKSATDAINKMIDEKFPDVGRMRS